MADRALGRARRRDARRAAAVDPADLLITVAVVSALTFLVAFYVERPTDFSAFPSLLLFVTLFRLALNVASTRLILTGTTITPPAPDRRRSASS